MQTIIAILLTLTTFVGNAFPLALGIKEEIAWQEYLKWEAEDIKYRETLEYDYNIIVDTTATVLFTGTYTECYHNLADFEATYGACSIMPA